MSAREFRPVSYPIEGRRIHTYTLTCSKCGCVDHIGQQNMGEAVAQDQVPKKFAAKGWTVGRRAQDDLCPEHTRQEEERRRSRPALKIVEAPVQQLKADPPRKMSFSDKRVIIAKLEDVYVSEQVGYDTGWNDERVANDLGVPRAWVEEIRDANFGPIRVDEASVAAIQHAEALLQKANDALAQAQELERRVAALVTGFRNELAASRSALEKIAPIALGRKSA